MDFTSVLSQKASDVDRPPVLPTGFYVMQVAKVPEGEDFESSRTGDQFRRLTFQATVVAPHDVDEDELAEYGNPAGAPLRKTFLFNMTEGKDAERDRSVYNLKRFLIDHLQMDEGDNTLEQLIEECVGYQFIGEVTHRPDPNDPEIIYAELGKTAAV